MSSDPGIGGGVGAPWYRVVAIPDVRYGGTAERDYASVLPAVLDAAQSRRPFVTGWLSRGGGAPLELITNAGPLPSAPRDRQHPYEPSGEPFATLPGRPDRQDRCELLFPWGARGVPCPDSLVTDLDKMVWAPCPGRQAPPLPAIGAEPGGWRGQPGSAGAAGLPGPAAAAGSSWLAGGASLTATTPTLFEVALTTLMAGRSDGW